MIDSPELGFPWVRVPLDQTLHLTICGEPESYHVHWVRTAAAGKPVPVRCVARDGDSCSLCTQGVGKRVRYVIPVLHEHTTKLLELGNIQHPFLAMKEQWIQMARSEGRADGQWEGQQIAVGRDRPVRNAEIWIRSTGWNRLSPEQHVQIAGLVATLGREQLNVLRREQARTR